MTIVSVEIWTIARKVCTEKQLHVLELREGHGMSLRTIALSMDIDHSTVVGHLNAARRRIAKELDNAPAPTLP